MGRAMAEQFGSLGARVAIVGRRADVLQETAEHLVLQGVDVACEAADIRDPDAVKEAVHRIIDTFGQIDVLVNNAGGQFPKAAIDISAKGFDAVVRTNLYGTVNVTQAVAQAMMAAGGGVIVNIVVSSLERGIPGVAHTMAARAGVIGYMRTVAREWGPRNIRINAIGPGLIETAGFRQEMVQTGDPQVVEKTQRAVPLGRIGLAGDVAAMAVFLASPAASYVTGQYITVDGGNFLAEGISVLPVD